MRLLCTIEDVFDISGRGVVVVPGIPKESKFSQVQAGASVSVKAPNEFELRTTVGGLETGVRRPLAFVPVLLGIEATKANIPVGGELWLHEP